MPIRTRTSSSLSPITAIPSCIWLIPSVTPNAASWLKHAYQQTRQMLRSRKTGLTAKLARHGISLNHAVPGRYPATSVGTAQIPTRIGQAIAAAGCHGRLGDTVAAANRRTAH